MALKLVANISKKVPIDGMAFTSVQASCSIEGEVTDVTRAAEEIRRLYAIAEHAVDLQPDLRPHASTPPSTITANRAPVASPASEVRPPGRGAPAGISPAQRRYLTQLLDRNPSALGQILADHRLDSIGQLSSRAASIVIDRLKAVTA